MLLSMTGFGTASEQIAGIEYAVEIRSVNNRYLKCIIRLPDSWGSAESEMEKMLRSRIKRGTVTLSVRMKVRDAQAAYNVNTVALQEYVEQLQLLQTDSNPAFRIDLGSMLQLPGVCEQASMADLCGESADDLMRLASQAVDGLVAMRVEEGKAVATELAEYCDVIERHLAVVETRCPDVVRGYRDRLAARVEDLMSSGRAAIDEDTLAREVAIFAERCDVAEEVSRLTGHLQQFREALADEDSSGRKLDFLSQEMLREANTIASKGNDADIARAVVEIKTAIDRIKEQAQNVE